VTLLEITTYSSLINRKILVPSIKKPYLAVDEHFMMELMLPWVEKIRVDEKWYLSAYQDVETAIRSGVVAGAKPHYCRFGYYEHRMPYEIKVDEDWYLNEYADVKAAVATKHFNSGQAHFELLGYREGRFPHSGFRLATAD
jgi:hypothetical protein